MPRTLSPGRPSYSEVVKKPGGKPVMPPEHTQRPQPDTSANQGQGSRNRALGKLSLPFRPRTSQARAHSSSPPGPTGVPATEMGQGRESGEGFHVKSLYIHGVQPLTQPFPPPSPSLRATPAAVSVQGLRAGGIDVGSPLASRSDLGHVETMLSRASQPAYSPTTSPLPVPPSLKQRSLNGDGYGNSQQQSVLLESNKTTAVLPSSDDKKSAKLKTIPLYSDRSQNEPSNLFGKRILGSRYEPLQSQTDTQRRKNRIRSQRRRRIEAPEPVPEQSQPDTSGEERQRRIEAPSVLVSVQPQSGKDSEYSSIMERIQRFDRKMDETKRSMQEAMLELMEDMKRRTTVCESKIWQCHRANIKALQE